MSVDEAQAVPAGQPLPVRKLGMQAAAEYANLISIAEDLGFVVRACERLHIEMAKAQADREPVVAWSLWTAALVTYARCFENSKRKGLTIEDVRAVPLQGEVLEWHQFLVDMRNKHIAHSVNPFEIVSVGAVVGTSGNVEGVAHLLMRHIGVEDGGIGQTGMLALELQKLVNTRIEQQSSEVLRAAQGLTLDKLSRLPDLQAVAPDNLLAGTARP